MKSSLNYLIDENYNNLILVQFTFKRKIKLIIRQQSQSIEEQQQVEMARQQRPAKTGPYSKVNAYTQRPSYEQVFCVLFFLIVLVLHSIFIVPPIVAVIQHAVLIFLLALNYALILLIAYDYIYLTVVDPVDSLVNKTAEIDRQPLSEIKKCIICNCSVFLKSYHCMRCNRCTQNFDHHCKYLNNCVGGKNYEQFLRILITLTLYFLILIAQAIWVFVESYDSIQLQDYMISRWPVLIVMIFVVVVLLGVDSLLIYHFYLTLVRKMTTLEYIFRETPSNQSQSDNRTSSDTQQQQTQDRIAHQNQL